MKKWILVIITLASSFAFSQEFAVDKGSTLIMGKLGFDNYYLYTGDYDIENTTSKLAEISIAPRIHQFFLPRFALGGELQFVRTSQKIEAIGGSDDQDELSVYTWSVGPSFGYYFGQPETGVYPYLTLGVMYVTSGYSMPVGNRKGYDSDSIEGRDIKVGIGCVAAIRDHLGLVAELGYHSYDMSGTYNLSKMFSTPEDGHVVEISVGVAGILF